MADNERPSKPSLAERFASARERLAERAATEQPAPAKNLRRPRGTVRAREAPAPDPDAPAEQERSFAREEEIPTEPPRDPQPFPTTAYWKIDDSRKSAELFSGKRLLAQVYDCTGFSIGEVNSETLKNDINRCLLNSDNPLEAAEQEIGIGPVRDFRYEDGAPAPSARAYCADRAARFRAAFPNEQELRHYIDKAFTACQEYHLNIIGELSFVDAYEHLTEARTLCGSYTVPSARSLFSRGSKPAAIAHHLNLAMDELSGLPHLIGARATSYIWQAIHFLERAHHQRFERTYQNRQRSRGQPQPETFLPATAACWVIHAASVHLYQRTRDLAHIWDRSRATTERGPDYHLALLHSESPFELLEAHCNAGPVSEFRYCDGAPATPYLRDLHYELALAFRAGIKPEDEQFYYIDRARLALVRDREDFICELRPEMLHARQLLEQASSLSLKSLAMDPEIRRLLLRTLHCYELTETIYHNCPLRYVLPALKLAGIPSHSKDRLPHFFSWF